MKVYVPFINQNTSRLLTSVSCGTCTVHLKLVSSSMVVVSKGSIVTVGLS